MKILFVTDLYPIGEENIAKALFYLVQEWQKQGHSVEVIRANFIANTIFRGRKIIEEKIYNEFETKIYNLNFYTPFWFYVYKKLPKNFSLNSYDVIISHMPCGSLMAQKLLKRDKIKYVCGVHCSDIVVLNDFKYFPFRFALKNAYKNADKIAARSPILKKKIEEILPDIKNKTFVAFSGIDEEIIKKPLNNKITITTVASLIKRKNVDVVINVIKKLPQINLKIIGSGKEEKKLKLLAKNCPNIEFLGQIPRNQVIEELKKSDIFVLLSNNETFGLSYLEAMATGNIVIGKKADGIDGILVDNENGFLINPNENDLKRCIEKILLMKDKEIEIIKNNMKNTIEKLTLEVASKSYLSNIWD